MIINGCLGKQNAHSVKRMMNEINFKSQLEVPQTNKPSSFETLTSRQGPGCSYQVQAVRLE